MYSGARRSFHGDQCQTRTSQGHAWAGGVVLGLRVWGSNVAAKKQNCALGYSRFSCFKDCKGMIFPICFTPPGLFSKLWAPSDHR